MRFQRKYIATLIALVGLSAHMALAQVDTLSTNRSIGMQVVLTNSGFGLGGYVSTGVGRAMRLSLELVLGAAKDEREVAFFDRFGRRDVPNKANYLLELPLHVGIERRLFQSKIEENFRPFILVTGGPLLGWAYPYFEDDNNNGLLDTEERSFDVISGVTNGHIEPGVSFGIYLGAHFGEIGTSSQGVRIGYRLSYYKNEIALLDTSIKAPSRSIGTPVISVYFGRSRSRPRSN